MAEVTEKVIEETADAVEFIAEEVDQVAEAIRGLSQIKIKYALIGASAGAIAGAAVGFVVAYKKAETKYEKIADEEIKMMREHYAAKSTAAEQEQTKEILAEKVEELKYAAPNGDGPPPAPELEVTPGNVFDKQGEPGFTVEQAWNYAKAAKERKENPGQPYILHKDEYESNESGISQTTITYYAGDDVLADERDQVLDKKDEVVGVDNLERFGFGSEDPNVLYIRNEKLSLEFEVVRSDGKYAEEVHGFTEGDLQHSDMRRHRSHRHFDDE